MRGGRWWGAVVVGGLEPFAGAGVAHCSSFAAASSACCCGFLLCLAAVAGGAEHLEVVGVVGASGFDVDDVIYFGPWVAAGLAGVVVPMPYSVG